MSRTPTPDNTDHDLLVDDLRARLAQFEQLKAGDATERDRALADLGGSGPVEHEIVVELATTKALAHPERFVEAHIILMHALEVLARNGGREPSQLRAGQKVTRLIARRHQAHVADSLSDLYSRRLAWAPPRDDSRWALVRARLDVERAKQSYKKSGGGVPTFLAGGVVASSVTQVASSAAKAAAGSRVGIIVAVVAAFAFLVAASWITLLGASVARRRIRLTLDRPLAALWETVGSCGQPPRDTTRTFVIVALLLIVAGWLLIGTVVVLAVAVF
jgi:hypothetical protein